MQLASVPKLLTCSVRTPEGSCEQHRCQWIYQESLGMILAMPVLTCFDCQLPDGTYRVFPITDTDPKECPYCHGGACAVYCW